MCLQTKLLKLPEFRESSKTGLPYWQVFLCKAQLLGNCIFSERP